MSVDVPMSTQSKTAKLYSCLPGANGDDDKFCMAIRTNLKVIDETSYKMTVTFNNVRGSVSGVNANAVGYGHLGFAFNYWDKDNYDFVYKRCLSYI